MTPEQRAFVNDRLMETVEHLRKRKATGPWWRRLAHWFKCVWDVWECVETYETREPRTCNVCDSNKPSKVLGFTQQYLYDNMELGSLPAALKSFVVVACPDCQVVEILDAEALGIVDSEGHMMGPRGGQP